MKSVLVPVAILALSSLAKADEPLIGKDNSPSTTGGRSTSVPELPGKGGEAEVDEKANSSDPKSDLSHEEKGTAESGKSAPKSESGK